MLSVDGVWSALSTVRSRQPLVHNITNYVVMNNTANALLAVGASPAMVHAVEEVEEFVRISQALVVNIGTLSPAWVESMVRAGDTAKVHGIPWVLDPVGVGATRLRSAAAADLIRRGPAVIRGNASEIRTLAGLVDSAGKGVDSAHGSEAAVDAARALARETGAAVAVTGVVDYVTDGERVAAIANGHRLMACVTGMGCTATALVGAFAAVERDFLAAAASALAVLGVAGEVAAGRAQGPGSFQMHLLDALYGLDRETLVARARLS
ncbi:MAG TPA: hydroxyethylthiazole kinase [Azospirillaceae bacterium]|nr:hydroxyethylthiazole kinase [Azospirillaceae bacterium]